MKDGKKIIIIIAVVVCLLITFLVIFLTDRDSGPKVNIDNNGNGNVSGSGQSGNGNSTGAGSGSGSEDGNGVTSSGGKDDSNSNKSTYYKISNYSEFFSVQNAINKTNEQNISFIAKEMYVNKSDNNYYYFVNGSLMINDVGEEDIDYTKSVNYLVVVDTNSKSYEVTKLVQSISSLAKYAKDFKVTNKEIKNDTIFKKTNLSTEKVITSYIEYFKYMLVLDTKSAYNMLYSETKDNYANYEDFYKQVPTIYNSLTSKLFSYSTMQNDDKNKFAVEDDNRNRIVIYENDIMDFKISYNIL